MGTILLIVLLLIVLGSFPTYSYSRKWGYGPSGVVSLLLIVLLILLFTGSVPWGWSTHTGPIIP